MHKENIFDKEKVHFNLIKYKKFGKTFELVVEPDLAINLKATKSRSDEDIRNMLRAEKIFFDAQKGALADEKDLIEVFGTKDFFKIAKKMLDEGEVQLTSEYREQLREEKRKKIVQLIHRVCIDPKSGLPHPVTRIENAIHEAKVKIDEYASAEDQLQEVINKLKPIIPIKMEEKLITITMNMHQAAKLRGIMLGYGTIEHEEWYGEMYICKLKVPAGIYADLVDELNGKTHGGVDIKVENKN
jgi:ribosome maturation protein SDO1